MCNYTFTFDIPMPPISVNHTHMTIRNGMRIKKKETRIWESEFRDYILANYFQEVSEITKTFDGKKNCLAVRYWFYLPLITKKGLISKRAGDLDNWLKMPNDMLINKILGLDDSLIVDLMAKKSHSLKPLISIEIEILTYS